MSSTLTDQIDGISTSTAVKAPVRVATTANITLSGTQTIDGVAVVANDRVLVKDQTDATENGIYDVKANAWTRSPDFDGNRDVRNGTIVLVNSGTLYTNSAWQVSASDPITIGTTSITFDRAYGQFSVANVNTITALRDADTDPSVVFVLGHTTAGDGGHGEFRYVSGASAGTYTDDDGITIVPTGGNGSAAWIRLLTNEVIVVEYFGSDPDTSIQAAIDAANSAGGGLVRCARGATYTMTSLPIVKAGVILDMNRSTFNATLSGSTDYGVRLGNNSHIKNGTINVTSSGSPGTSFIYHACISIGETNGGGGTVASPSTYSTVHGWSVENMTLGTTRTRCPVIVGMGDIYNGVIRNITIPDSATCSGINLDWSDIGTGVDSNDVPATRTAFDAGNCYTTHPHNILIENVSAGNLSVAASGDVGSNIVRLSGCYGIKVRNISAENVTLTGFRHVGGDLGFEFAPANIKHLACKGNTLDGMHLLNMQANGTAFGCYIDTFADNVHTAIYEDSYTNLLDPRMHGAVKVSNCSIIGPNGDTQYGIRIIQARGVTVENSNIRRWTFGVYIDEYTKDISIVDCDSSGNRQHGIKVGTNLLRENTEDITIDNCHSYGNGTDTTGHGIMVTRCHNAWITRNRIGTVGESTQDIGLRVEDNGAANKNINIIKNHVYGASSNVGYSLTASSPADPYEFRQIGMFQDNTAETSLITLAGGQGLIPVRMLLTSLSRPCVEYLKTTSGAPTDGLFYTGDLITQASPTASGAPMHSCTESGKFGTLAGLTNAATTNGSKDITVSLQSKTATTTANSYSVTVNDATNIRAGLKCTISAAGITNATILSVSGTTLQLDVPAKSAQTAVTFTTAGVIEGEVISLDTTPAITGAIVMKVDSNTVTLSNAAGSTETGRTATYTTPVFKAHASIAA